MTLGRFTLGTKKVGATARSNVDLLYSGRRLSTGANGQEGNKDLEQPYKDNSKYAEERSSAAVEIGELGRPT